MNVFPYHNFLWCSEFHHWVQINLILLIEALSRLWGHSEPEQRPQPAGIDILGAFGDGMQSLNQSFVVGDIEAPHFFCFCT